MKYKLTFKDGDFTVKIDHDPDNDGINIENEHWRYMEIAELDGEWSGWSKDFSTFLWSNFGLKGEIEEC